METLKNNFPHYLTPMQLVKKHPAFSIGAVRDWIFHAEYNGMKQMNVFNRIGGRIFIDEQKFFDWVATNPSSTGMPTKGGRNGR